MGDRTRANSKSLTSKSNAAKLAKSGVRTTADLAAKALAEGKSNYQVLKDIVGADDAHWLLNELSTYSFPAPKS